MKYSCPLSQLLSHTCENVFISLKLKFRTSIKLDLSHDHLTPSPPAIHAWLFTNKQEDGAPEEEEEQLHSRMTWRKKQEVNWKAKPQVCPGYVYVKTPSCQNSAYIKRNIKIQLPNHCRKQDGDSSKNWKYTYHMIQHPSLGSMFSKRYLHTSIHNSTSHNNQMVEATQCPPANERINKMQYIHDGMVFSHNKKEPHATQWMDELWGHCAK